MLRGYRPSVMRNAGAADLDAPAILDAMRVEQVDPRDTDWEIGPTVDYRAIFWTEAGESTEFDLLGAHDVHAAIAWTDVEARSRGCVYTLYAKVRSSEGAGLVWLAGQHPLG
jgi:hypothetical protein